MSQIPLEIRILGRFEIRYDGAPLEELHGGRMQSLLAYLLLADESPSPRQNLAFQLWPDTSESNARNNLRQLVYQLRAVLPEPERFLAIDAITISWRSDSDQSVDVTLFRKEIVAAAAAKKQANGQFEREWLEKALTHYRGDLLPSCYDEWIRPERAHLQQKAYAALHRLTELQETARDYDAASTTMALLRRLDPLDEQAYAQDIRLHALRQDVAGARRVYQLAVDVFARELDEPPGDEIERAYALSQRVARETRADPGSAMQTEALAPMVGRTSEWHLLRSTWARAAGGQPLMLLVSGEAGIGKSRLAEELHAWVAQEGAARARTRSFAAEGTLSLAPVAEWLRAPALRSALETLEPIWRSEVARLLPELLAASPNLPRPAPIVEYGQRRRFFEALARAVCAVPQPLLLWVDDLQWCDAETLEWLHFLLRFNPAQPLLIIGTARSEEFPPDHPLAVLARQLRSEGKLLNVELAPLDAAETARLVMQVQGSEPESEMVMHLYRQTGGNPLFVVETLRAGFNGALEEMGSGALIGANRAQLLAPRVFAVIERRIAQLSPAARRVAEVGAVFGRAFTWEMLTAAAIPYGDDNELALADALDELWRRRIVREQSPNVYDFTHDNLREVTYALVSAPQRHLLHRRVAGALERLFADQIEPVCARDRDSL